MIAALEAEQETAIQSACVKVIGTHRSGSGFFVTSSHIVTCAHVVGPPGTHVRIESSLFQDVAEVIATTDESYPDIAVLKVSSLANSSPPLPLPLFDDSRPYDYCYTFGFSDLNANDPATLRIAGRSFGNQSLVKFDRGQIRPGMSGSPVINLRTLAVCAVIQETRDRRSDLGAWGLPVSALLSSFPWLQTERTTPSLPLLPFGYYARQFLAQYGNRTLRTSQAPIVGPIFSADLVRCYVAPMFVDEHGSRHPSIDDGLQAWRRDISSKYLVLFAEYGAGKTSACLKFSYDLLRSLENPAQDRLVPLFVSLNDLGGGTGYKSVLALFAERYRIPAQDISAYTEFASRFKLLLILDGFDELTGSFDSDLVRQRLADLAPLLVSASKVLLTCRTTLFRDKSELHYAFPIDARESRFLDDFLARSPFSTWFLLDFDTDQIRDYIQRTSGESSESFLNSLTEGYDLGDLARRPLLLSMIAQSLTHAQHSNTEPHCMTAAELYTRYTREWLQRESSRSRLTVSARLHALQTIAVYLISENVTALHRDQLVTLLEKCLPKLAISDLDYDFVNASFLVRTIDEYFGFSHRSFLEFFVATAIWRELERRRLPSTFGRQPIVEGVLKFLVQLIQGSERLPRVRRFLLSTFDAVADELHGKHFRANLATLLCRLGLSFAGRNLAGMNLAQADLRNIDLRGSDLRGTRFDGCNLANADLSKTDARGAVFRNAFLHRTKFQCADLRGTDLWNIRMVGGPPTIWRAAFTPRASAFAVGSGSGELVLYSDAPEEWPEYSRLRLTDTGILHFAFSTDGKRVVVTDRSATVRIFHWQDLAGGRVAPVQVFLGGSDNVRWAEFSPDGSHLLTASRDHRVRVWSLEPQLAVCDVTQHAGPVMCAAWHPSKPIVASCGYDGVVMLTQFQDGISIVLSSEVSHDGIARAVTFSQDGLLLASAGEDEIVNVWEVANPEAPTLLQSMHLESRVFCLAWISRDILAAGTEGGDVWFIEIVNDGAANLQRFAAHRDIVRSVDVGSGVTEGSMLSASWDGSVLLWKLSAGEYSYRAIVHPLEGDLVSEERALFAGAQLDGILGVPPRFRRHFGMHAD